MLVGYPVSYKIGYIENLGSNKQTYLSVVLDLVEGVTMGSFTILRTARFLA
jgi:hypothetical protein